MDGSSAGGWLHRNGMELGDIALTSDTERFLLSTPKTTALQKIFAESSHQGMSDDLLFLERWEACPLPGPAAALRVSQIRRANPELAAAIRRELQESFLARGRSARPVR